MIILSSTEVCRPDAPLLIKNMDIVIIGCCRSGHNFIRKQVDSWGFDTFNYEDVVPEQYPQIPSKGKYPHNPKNIIVVRDLLNWWASYITWCKYDNYDTMFNI